MTALQLEALLYSVAEVAGELARKGRRLRRYDATDSARTIIVLAQLRYIRVEAQQAGWADLATVAEAAEDLLEEISPSKINLNPQAALVLAEHLPPEIQ